MNIGDIVFVRGKSPVSSIVRFFDEGEFSHVALAVSNTHIVEIDWNTRVRIVPMEYEDVEIIEMHLSEKQREDIIKHSISYCGSHYDFLSIIRFVLKGEFPPFNPNLVICSELVTAILVESNCWDSSDFLTPNELYVTLLS